MQLGKYLWRSTKYPKLSRQWRKLFNLIFFKINFNMNLGWWMFSIPFDFILIKSYIDLWIWIPISIQIKKTFRADLINLPIEYSIITGYISYWLLLIPINFHPNKKINHSNRLINLPFGYNIIAGYISYCLLLIPVAFRSFMSWQRSSINEAACMTLVQKGPTTFQDQHRTLKH